MHPRTAFRYKALRQNGTVVTGGVVAVSEAAAAEMLLRDGLHAVAIRPSRSLATRRAPSADDHATALRTLAEMLDAGLPPARALHLLRGTAPPSWAPGLEAACAAVEQGASVATALAEPSLGLPPVVHGLMHAGEAGMGLAAATRQAADLMARRAALRHSLASALTYPAVLLVSGAASVMLLVTVVLPRFAVILHGLQVTLPLSTRLVLAVGEISRRFAPTAALAALLTIVVLRVWNHTPDGARAWAEFTLRFPLIGELRHALAGAQAMHALAALLASGVPLSTGIDYAAMAAGNAAVAARLRNSREAIRRGEALSVALTATAAVPVPAVRLVRAGEETGRLAEMLAHAASLEQQRAERWIRSAVRLVEPALILSFGLAVAAVAAALFQAMYAIRPTV